MKVLSDQTQQTNKSHVQPQYFSGLSSNSFYLCSTIQLESLSSACLVWRLVSACAKCRGRLSPTTTIETQVLLAWTRTRAVHISFSRSASTYLCFVSASARWGNLASPLIDSASSRVVGEVHRSPPKVPRILARSMLSWIFCHFASFLSSSAEETEPHRDTALKCLSK